VDNAVEGFHPVTAGRARRAQSTASISVIQPLCPRLIFSVPSAPDGMYENLPPDCSRFSGRQVFR
jgi:hypothetical protein